MNVLIKGMKMPENCVDCVCFDDYEWQCRVSMHEENVHDGRPDWCPLVEVPPHGRLIDADALRAKMYHEAFETDTPMQKWDSGCWIRYKMFEKTEESAPTIIPSSEEGE